MDMTYRQKWMNGCGGGELRISHWIESKWNIEKCSNQCFGWALCSVFCILFDECIRLYECMANTLWLQRDTESMRFKMEWNPFNFITDKGDRSTIETRLPQKHALNVFTLCIQVCARHHSIITAYLSFWFASNRTITKTQNKNKSQQYNMDGKYWNNNFFAVASLSIWFMLYDLLFCVFNNNLLWEHWTGLYVPLAIFFSTLIKTTIVPTTKGPPNNTHSSGENPCAKS